MRYPKAKVISGLETIIKERTEKAQTKQAERDAAEAGHQARYDREVKPKLLEVLSKLYNMASLPDVRLSLAQIESASEDPNRGPYSGAYKGWDRELAYQPLRHDSSRDGTNVVEHQRLLAFLRTVEDDSISTHGVKEAGFDAKLLTAAVLKG